MNHFFLYKQFLKLWSGLLILSLSALGLLNFVIDPLQYYRRNPSRTLYAEERWQVPGFIKSFQYNQVIIGTSMTRNLPAKALRQKFGFDLVRLSLGAASLLEQSITLQFALKTGKVKSVIWGIEPRFLNYKSGKLPASFPLDLFARTFKGHLIYLLNGSIILEPLKHLWAQWQGRQGQVAYNPDDYYQWDIAEDFKREKILQQYQRAARDRLEGNNTDKNKGEDVDIETRCKNFEKDCIQVIQYNPSVQFIVYVPPYSLASYKLLSYAGNEFKEYLQCRQFIFEKLCALPNVTVYDFETDLSIIRNLDNYRDFVHHSANVSHYIVECFSTEKRRVTSKNIETYQEAFLALPQQDFL